VAETPPQEDDDLQIELIGPPRGPAPAETPRPAGGTIEEKLDPEDNAAIRLKRLQKDESGGVRIFIAHKVLLAVHRHARTDLTRELAGALFGRQYHSHRGPFLEIQEAVRAPGTTGSRAHVTITPEVWAEIEQERQVRCPGAVMVGWYHTHPNLGVFLSRDDRFIHQNFFREDWMVALVVDPVANVTKLWSLVNGKLTPRGFSEMTPEGVSLEAEAAEDDEPDVAIDPAEPPAQLDEEGPADPPAAQDADAGGRHVLSDLAQPIAEAAEGMWGKLKSALGPKGKPARK
jgi:proteasome lid subunit RPN8/RPN11